MTRWTIFPCLVLIPDSYYLLQAMAKALRGAVKEVRDIVRGKGKRSAGNSGKK